MHQAHVRHQIKILRVARCSLTISFRKGNPPGNLPRGQKTPLQWPSFIVASQDERAKGDRRRAALDLNGIEFPAVYAIRYSAVLRWSD